MSQKKNEDVTIEKTVGRGKRKRKVCVDSGELNERGRE